MLRLHFCPYESIFQQNFPEIILHSETYNRFTPILNSYPKLISHFIRYLQQNHLFTPALYQDLALTSFRRGKTVEGLVCFYDMIQKKFPISNFFYNQVLLYAVDLPFPDIAKIIDLRPSLQLDTKDPEFIETLMYVFLAKRAYAEMDIFVEKEIFGNNTRDLTKHTFYLISIAYSNQGNMEELSRVLRKAKQLFGDLDFEAQVIKHGAAIQQAFSIK